MNFSSGKILKLFNVISVRKKLNSIQLNYSIQDLYNHVVSRGNEPVGPLITALYDIKVENKVLIMDVELIGQCKDKMVTEGHYKFNDEVTIENCMFTRFDAGIQEIQGIFKNIEKYLKNQNIVKKTPMYIVFQPQEDSDKFLVDVFIGV